MPRYARCFVYGVFATRSSPYAYPFRPAGEGGANGDCRLLEGQGGEVGVATSTSTLWQLKDKKPSPQ